MTSSNYKMKPISGLLAHFTGLNMSFPAKGRHFAFSCFNSVLLQAPKLGHRQENG